jgi:hypothetical protein
VREGRLKRAELPAIVEKANLLACGLANGIGAGGRAGWN